jgi:molybdate transport system substrate-binding protein
MTGRRIVLGGMAALLALPARAAPPGVQVYAAMTFRPALEAVLAAWRATGGTATGIYGPTPVLVRQIEQGAPADLLLTADASWMDEAVGRNLVQPATRADLLGNDLVLAGPAGSPDVPEITRDFPLVARLGGGRLAMCDPDRDPAGRFARQSLASLGFWTEIAPIVAVAESSPAAVAMLDRGEVPLAACFATDLYGDAHAAIIGRFPDASHAPIIYPAALAAHPQSPEAAALLAFLHGPRAMAIFTRFGYRAPRA